MNFQVPLPISQPVKIKHDERIMLMGSCFTEHISSRLQQMKFSVCTNPNGILFNPLSVVKSLKSYLEEKRNFTAGTFLLNETWGNWDFHSHFSHTDKATALQQMQDSVRNAGIFLKQTNWLIITLGSAFQYFLKPGSSFGNKKTIAVANCHRAPANCFEKRLLTLPEMTGSFEKVIADLQKSIPGIRIIFTVSPVRHIREGLIENNRSKARLLELVHHLVATNSDLFYFPAYEIVIDVLRDYRFYDIDMVHPNYQATEYVWEQFEQAYFDPATRDLLRQIKEIHTAFHHKPRFPDTKAHQKFKSIYLQKIKKLKSGFSYLNFEDELKYFSADD